MKLKSNFPNRQDIIWLNFQPSTGKEMLGRHPAMVLSYSTYSMVTGLVMVMPITHARHNRLKNFFIPIHSEKINGYINPLQVFTFDCQGRHMEMTGEMVTADKWAEAVEIHRQIIGI